MDNRHAVTVNGITMLALGGGAVELRLPLTHRLACRVVGFERAWRHVEEQTAAAPDDVVVIARAARGEPAVLAALVFGPTALYPAEQ